MQIYPFSGLTDVSDFKSWISKIDTLFFALIDANALSFYAKIDNRIDKWNFSPKAEGVQQKPVPTWSQVLPQTQVLIYINVIRGV